MGDMSWWCLIMSVVVLLFTANYVFDLWQFRAIEREVEEYRIREAERYMKIGGTNPMTVKDLIGSLEKGNRTKEMLGRSVGSEIPMSEAPSAAGVLFGMGVNELADMVRQEQANAQIQNGMLLEASWNRNSQLASYRRLR